MAQTIQSLYEVHEHQKIDLLLRLLKEDTKQKAVAIVLRTKEGVHALTTTIRNENIVADSIFGNKKAELRDRVVKEFQEGKIQILVSTEASLRDIELTGIHHLIHFDSHELDVNYIRYSTSEIHEISTIAAPKNEKLLNRLGLLSNDALIHKCIPDFKYDEKPQKIKVMKNRDGGSNKTQSKPLQHKKPKLKNKGPRRKTGRTSKR